MKSFRDIVNKFNTLVETQRPGGGHQKSKYEKKGEDIEWAGFGSATYDATGKSGGFLAEANQDNTILALFGPSGSGKSYYKQILVNSGWRDIRTNTTRAPRGPDDVEYNFLSNSEFSELLSAGQLINTNEYLGEMYGTLVSEFLAPGKAVMMTDVTSLNSLKQTAQEHGKELVLAYTQPPSAEEMEKRHLDRGTPERIGVAAAETKQEGEILQRGDTYIIGNIDDFNTLLRNLQGNDGKIH
tara:strand:+ start:732 stop:1454 length:723 start_codon:yes stop_codon:yes gene_type:complete